jgi:hypothetical protein
MFDLTLSSSSNTFQIARVDDTTTEEQQAAGIMTIKLSLKELGNPLHVSSAILTIQADISAIAALRARIAQGKRVYIATQPECIQLTSSPMLTVVTGYGISFE